MTPQAIAALVEPYLDRSPGPLICAQLTVYLELILKWNARFNLTAIRTPEEIVRRHFGESLFVATRLGPCQTLLDFGSGAGFPGLPIQLLRPDLQVTLAESRSKKASFLREVVRSLGLSTEVWAGRVEAMPAERRFDAVTLRAVDTMEAAVREASVRAREQLLILGTASPSIYPRLADHFRITEPLALPQSSDRALWIAHRRSFHPSPPQPHL